VLHGGRAVWLTPPFFGLRGAAYLAVWWGSAALVVRAARRAEARPDEAGPAQRTRALAAPALAVGGLLAGFAGMDWLMAFDPHFVSSLYGLWFLAGQGVSALAATVLAMAWWRRRGPGAPDVGDDLAHDWGNLLLAFLMVWAYLAFSQYLLVWSADLPEEAGWYLARSTRGGRLLAGGLALLHFAVPFALLLPRSTKRHLGRLAAVAGLVLVLRWVDLYWQVAPELASAGFVPAWTDPLAVVVVGGGWLTTVARRLAARPPDVAPGARAP